MAAASSTLDKLKSVTTVVADTGDFASITRFQPQDATTNPSLILKAAQMPEYAHIVQAAIAEAAGSLDRAMDLVAVKFGIEILKVIPGRVSTEVDARLSYDTAGTIAKVHQLAALYAEAGIDYRARVLFKIAGTWEGIRAAEVLERDGIHTNITLIFSYEQAIACAQAGVFLISPFVGRIMDWFVANTTTKSFPAESDPGVLSVRKIYTYFKKHGHNTIVMGASFRNAGQILALAGCDYLTIAPNLLDELARGEADVVAHLSPAAAAQADVPAVQVTEKLYRWALNQDAMATEKLAHGIRAFAADIEILEGKLTSLMQGK